MALPYAACPSDVPDPSCVAGFDIIETFLTDLVVAARTFIPAECVNGTPEELEGVVTITDQHFVSNSISVVIDGIKRNAVKRGGTETGMMMWEVNTSVILIEPGWPIMRAEGGEIILPEFSEISVAAIHSLAHGEKLLRTIHNMSNDHSKQGYYIKAIGDALPTDADTQYAGWAIDVDFRLPTNRVSA